MPLEGFLLGLQRRRGVCRREYIAWKDVRALRCAELDVAYAQLILHVPGAFQGPSSGCRWLALAPEQAELTVERYKKNQFRDMLVRQGVLRSSIGVQ